MVEKSRSVQEINAFIQTKMSKLKITSVSPVEATRWLVEAGLREKVESRPGSYLRSLCRAGKITGAKQINRSWRISRK
jgi:hypothetical protein